MKLRMIQDIKSIDPLLPNDSAIAFGVCRIEEEYLLGAYYADYAGDWDELENKDCDDLKFGPLWVIVSWDAPETNVILIDCGGNERKIYLPKSNSNPDSIYYNSYWIAEDGSSYYATSNHKIGEPDLTYEQALVPEHLARKSLSPEQENPAEEEISYCGIREEDTLKIKGQLIDQLTNEPVSGAKLISGYEFSPKEVLTDENGNFEFFVNSKMYRGDYYFYADCYGYSSVLGILTNPVHTLVHIEKRVFDPKEDITMNIKENITMNISGKNEIDIGKLYIYPRADISIKSDIAAIFTVKYKYKYKYKIYMYGYDYGEDNFNYSTEHYQSNILPLDYDVSIEFEDESGNEYNSTTYRVPSKRCSTINLRYFNGESEWSVK
jgi:hypothetical protein